MSYLVIEDFRGGVDTRKSRLSAPAGTLTDLLNAHITPGGDIEKRKAFTVFAALWQLDGNDDKGVYGFQPLEESFAVFGSALAHGTGSTQNQPVLEADLPTTTPPLVYYQLKHPAVLDGANYDRTKHRITEVLCSEQFGGKPWVAVRFADDNVFAYYDGAIIPAFRNGVVIDGLLTPAALAKQLAATLSSMFPGYTIEHTPGNAYVDVKAPVDGTFSILPDKTSTSGSLTNTKRSDGQGATEGVGASVNLTFTGGSDGTISSVTAPDGDGGTVELLASPVAYSTSLANTATLLADMINQTGSSPHYTATADTSGANPVVTIHAPASLGATVNALNVVVTFTGTLTFDSSGEVALAASVTPAYVNGSASQPVAVTVYSSLGAQASGSGGVGPYTYAWTCDPGFEAVNPTAAYTRFRSKSPLSPRQYVSGTATCTVTDSSTPAKEAAASCQVYLINDYESSL